MQQYLSVVESLDRLAVDVCDEVSRPQTSVEGGAALVHLHHQVVDCEEVGVTEVHPDGADREAEAARTTTNDDGRLEGVDEG